MSVSASTAITSGKRLALIAAFNESALPPFSLSSTSNREREREPEERVVARQRVRGRRLAHGHAGDMDYLLRVVVQDMAHYSRFIMDTLLKHPSVEDCKTSFVLDRVKATTAVPL